MRRVLLRIVTHHTKEGETASIAGMLYVGTTSQIFVMFALLKNIHSLIVEGISLLSDCADEGNKTAEGVLVHHYMDIVRIVKKKSNLAIVIDI